MAAIPKPETTSTVAAIYRWWESRAEDGHRAHLGASVIGHACDRYLWNLFHWVAREGFDGRMLRLFEAGKAFEPRIVAELRAIGVTVWDTDEFGRQHRVSAVHGHFGGSMDGVAEGLPEAPKTPHLLEFKTHNQKSFDALVKHGVRKAKPQHWAQMQVYMGLADLTRAMYLAENKNSSEVYSERLEFDPVEFEKLMARAARIITANEPPARLGETADALDCRWCAYREHCHGQALPEVNCRTCAHSTAMTHSDAAEWQCTHAGTAIDLATQRTGCNGHRFIPVLLERVATQVDATDEPDGNLAVTYQLPNGGGTFVNGYPPGFSSAEIVAAQGAAAALADDQVQAVKAAVPTARVVKAEATEAA